MYQKTNLFFGAGALPGLNGIIVVGEIELESDIGETGCGGDLDRGGGLDREGKGKGDKRGERHGSSC